MNRTWKTICAIGSTLLLLISFILIFIFAWIDGHVSTILCVCGLFVGIALAPIIHELGHVYFANKADMDVLYCKAFCVRFQIKDGKRVWSFASPFADDQTQIVPKTSGNMYYRAIEYTLGGLKFGGVLLAVVLVLAVSISLIGWNAYFLWGIVPYVGYLEILNFMPIEYASGKTDMLVYSGIKNEDDVERVMLSAMEIQGHLYEGKHFSEIEESLFINLPQLCEDEPLFALILDLKYRYYLEREDFENAADCLNRLVNAQAYIPALEMTKIATELVYMHSIMGNLDLAQESSKFCEDYLRGETADAKRALAAYSKALGDKEASEILIAQAHRILANERIEGVKKSEQILLNRL